MMEIEEMVISPERLELRYKLQLNTNRKSGSGYRLGTTRILWDQTGSGQKQYGGLKA